MGDLYGGKGAGPGIQGTGLSHAYFGTGVGKSTRSVGLAVRAAGAGLQVAYVQFMKSGDTSETVIFATIPNLDYLNPGPIPFVGKEGPQPVHFEHARASLDLARGALAGGAQVLVCDEILNAVHFGLITPQDVLDLIDACRGKVELVLTGAAIDPAILAAVDYATEFVARKHPYYNGQSARRGIEF